MEEESEADLVVPAEVTPDKEDDKGDGQVDNCRCVMGADDNLLDVDLGQQDVTALAEENVLDVIETELENSPTDIDTENVEGDTAVVEEEEEVDLAKKVETLEDERGQLTSEVLEKDLHIEKLERELAGLKSELHAKEEDFETEKETAERRYKQLIEETAAKVGEVSVSISSTINY